MSWGSHLKSSVVPLWLSDALRALSNVRSAVNEECQSPESEDGYAQVDVSLDNTSGHE
jgi:hypothetical protein